MFTHKSKDDLIQFTAQYCRNKIATLSRVIENSNPRGHQYRESIAARGAYNDVLYLLEHYSISSEQERPTVLVAGQQEAQ